MRRRFWVSLVLVAFLSLSIGEVGSKTKKYSLYSGYDNLVSQSYKTQTYKPAKQQTFKRGSTTYYTNQYYSNGYNKVARSSSARSKYLKAKGYSKVPYGYEVDHIIPLSKGGSDTPSNMQLLPKNIHKLKTAREKRY